MLERGRLNVHDRTWANPSHLRGPGPPSAFTWQPQMGAELYRMSISTSWNENLAFGVKQHGRFEITFVSRRAFIKRLDGNRDRYITTCLATHCFTIHLNERGPGLKMSPPNPINFTILDTSPLFQYLPSQDGPISTSWMATYSNSSDSTWQPSSLGVGVSSHRTTRKGASVQLDWIGTAIYLYGNAPSGGYTVQLDGLLMNATMDGSGVLFSKTGLDYRKHSVVVGVVEGETSISSAIITIGVGELGSTVHNSTIPTTDLPLPNGAIMLSGSWILPGISYGGLPDLPVPRIGTQVKGSSISFRLTSTTAFYIVGHVNYDHGPYHVIFTPPADLGPPEVSRYNGSSRWIGLNTVKYMISGLNRSRTYYVELINDSDLWYDQSQVVFLDATPPSSSVGAVAPSQTSSSEAHSFGSGAIAGIAVSCAIALLVLFAFLFDSCRQRRQNSHKHIVISLPMDTSTTPA